MLSLIITWASDKCGSCLIDGRKVDLSPAKNPRILRLCCALRTAACAILLCLLHGAPAIIDDVRKLDCGRDRFERNIGQTCRFSWIAEA